MDTLAMINQAEAALADLHTRMDNDAKLAYLDPFTLMRPDKPDWKVDGAQNVTTNAPAVFLNNVISLLTTAVWQTQVKGDINSRQERTLEQYTDALKYSINERLSRRGKPDLHEWESTHICLRGWIGKRILWRQAKQGNWYPEAKPVDMRWCLFEEGGDDFRWVAPKIWMSKSQIEAEYKVEGCREGVLIPLQDFWDGEKEEIWIDGKLAKTNKHRLGRPPFVILRAPEGFMIFDEQYLMVHEGESVLFLNRTMYPFWNQILTVSQTKAIQSIVPSYEHTVPPEKQGTPEEYPLPAGESIQVGERETYKPLQTVDTPRAFEIAREDIAGAMQRGGLPDVNYSDTATAITEQTELRNKLLSPRLKTLAQSNVLMYRMFIDQAIQGKIDVTLGAPGHKRHFSHTELGDPESYQISVKLMSKSKKQEIANLAEAGAARGLLSQETIIRDILQSDDPEGELDRLESEKAESADPALFYFRKACSLADEAEELTGEEADEKKLESMMMTDRGIKALMGQPGLPQQTQPNANPLMPLLGRQGATV